MTVVALSSTTIAVTTLPAEPGNPFPAELPELRQELLERVQLDQNVRMTLMQAAQEKDKDLDSFARLFPNSPVLKEVQRVDSDNQKWLVQVIERHGWPGRSLVGEDGAHAAWLLVQHAGRDIEFQKNCLALMKNAQKDEVAAADIAYLTDRIRIGEGHKQIYGTQLEFQDGRVVLKPVEDPLHLDDLRRVAGLQPIAAYLKDAEQILTLATRNSASRAEGAEVR
jgi:hypothetical protein